MLITLRSAFIKGLVTVLPIGLTVYLIYWLGVTLEHLLGGVYQWVVPERFYVPGLGLVTGVALLLLIGLAVNAWAVRVLLNLGERLLERIPLVKSVYGAVRDFVQFFSTAAQNEDMHRVVTVTLGDAQLIGFLTREQVPELGDTDERVAVYLPMSYQIGGYTLLLPRSSVRPLDLSAEEAMRLVLTAGLTKPEPAAARTPRPVDEPGAAPG